MPQSYIASIIGKEINEKSLKKYVFTSLIKKYSNEKGLPEGGEFVSKETITALKKYAENKNPLQLAPAKSLWKNLLIDAVSILKINDSREKIYSDSKSNTKKLVRNFSAVRKSSAFGIDNLAKYFDDFAEYEYVLYGVDKHYRDHINHVIKVWAIGISIIYNSEIKLNDKYNFKKDTIFNFEITELDRASSLSFSEVWSIWTIIALCHDLGYPIEKSAKINTQTKKIISHFGNMHFTELDYSFSILNTYLVEKFLNVISAKITSNSDKGSPPKSTQDTKNEAPKKPCSMSIQEKYKDKLTKSLEDYKHGIFSSLFLYKNLTFFSETDFSLTDGFEYPEDARQAYIRKEILRSIAGHTCPKMYHIDVNTLSFLLILCDELQETGRPTLENSLRGAEEKECKMTLKKFGKHNVSIRTNYNFDAPKKNTPEFNHLIISRFKNIHYLLRRAADDSNRDKLKFQWGINFTDQIFSLDFDATQNSFSLFKVVREYKLKTQSPSTSKQKKKIDIYD